MYRTLDSEKILATAASLERRIQARFPESGLLNVARELLAIAQEAQKRCRRISKPNVPLRIVVGLLMVLGLAIVMVVIAQVRVTDDFWDLTNFVESAEALVGDLVFVGVGALFLVTLETRLKRGRALAAINELRAIAHIIDMHQLTKDPEMILTEHTPTDVSPPHNMTPFLLSRYLDYCSEMLALVSKIGALYVQSFPDRDALSAVDEIENLTTGLSRKIWQKIMILGRYVPKKKPSSTGGKKAKTVRVKTPSGLFSARSYE